MDVVNNIGISCHVGILYIVNHNCTTLKPTFFSERNHSRSAGNKVRSFFGSSGCAIWVWRALLNFSPTSCSWACVSFSFSCHSTTSWSFLVTSLSQTLPTNQCQLLIPFLLWNEGNKGGPSPKSTATCPHKLHCVQIYNILTYYWTINYFSKQVQVVHIHRSSSYLDAPL